MLKIIAAVAENGVIGRSNRMLWRISSDFTWFRDATMGHPVVMGRKTAESIFTHLGKMLSGRRNLVLTHGGTTKIPRNEIEVVTWDEVLALAQTTDVFVAGGAEIYKLALPHAQELYLTHVHARPFGDTCFPDWDKTAWSVVLDKEGEQGANDDFPFTWRIYRKKSAFIEMTHVRKEDQRQVMESIKNAGHCPFCEENLLRYHTKPILHTGKHWILTENQWPYEGAQTHLLLVLRTHAETLSEIPAEAYVEFFEMLSNIEKTHNLPGGALGMRFGEPALSGATVRHIHAQIVSPKVGLGKPILFYIGSTASS